MPLEETAQAKAPDQSIVVINKIQQLIDRLDSRLNIVIIRKEDSAVEKMPTPVQSHLLAELEMVERRIEYLLKSIEL